MTTNLAVPRTRRAVILGALGGLVATAATLARAPEAEAGTDGDLTLGTTNNAVAPTELSAPLVAPALRVVGNGIGVQAVGQTALEALGGNIAVSAIADGNPLSPGSPGIGVIGWSRTNNSVGVLGWSTNGSTSTPATPAKTGVFGISTEDAASTGVVGRSTAGQGIRGEATTGVGARGEATTGVGVQAAATGGIGLQAGATTGVALAVSGRTTFNRSGRATIPINRSYVDVTVPGGLTTAANIFVTLQAFRSGVYVAAVRSNFPSAGRCRIYLNKVASATLTTPVAWFVLG
jgi:hypothetical protein